MRCPYCSSEQGRCATTTAGRSITECASCGRVVDERQTQPHHLFHLRAQDSPLCLVTSDLPTIPTASRKDDEDPFEPTGFITAFSTWSLEPYPVFAHSSLSFAGHLAELERVLETTSSTANSSGPSVVVDNLRAYLQIIDVASILGLDCDISDHAFQLFRDCSSATCLRNRSVEALATAALVQAIREAQEPRTLQVLIFYLTYKDFVLTNQNKVRQLTLQSAALMGAGEEGTPTKSSKSATSPQEVPTTPMYPDWSSSMQAFYGAGATPPFFASTVASLTPHPYMWGSQHPMMPPYGTPVPYPAIYPPGGVYAHPNMSMESRSTNPMTPGTLHGTAELDGKATKGKDGASSKKTKGTSGNHGRRKTGDSRKSASGSVNDVGTQSAESESEDSSDASDDNNNQEFSATKKGSFHQMLADAANAQNHVVPANFQTSVPGNPGVSMHPTSINMAMDLWNASSSGSEAMKLRSNAPGATPGMMNDQWIQDERELKRQKRKQSNRESARRSRLRKQAECEELQQKVEILSNENHTLRDELQRLSEECEKLTSENNSIKEELTTLCGPDAVSKLENSNCASTHVQSGRDEGNS